MLGIIVVFFLLYGVKYFLYKEYREKKFVKIFDYLLSIVTISFYIFFMLLFAVVYGMERLNTKIAVLLTVASFLLLVVKFFFINKKSMKYTVVIDVFYFIILVLFVLAG